MSDMPERRVRLQALNPVGWINPSLWKQLLLPVVALWVACAVLATGAAYLLAGRSTNSAFDRLLADDAHALSSKLRWNDGVASFISSKETADLLVFDSLSLSHYALLTDTGRKLIGDLSLKPPEGFHPPLNTPSYYDDSSRTGTALRVVALLLQPSQSDEAVWVLVAESEEKRHHVKDEIAIAIFFPAAIAGFIIIPLFYYGIRLGLLPTKRLSALITEHADHNLSPLPVEQVPEELRELVAHTNSLLQRLQLSVDEQRRFIADAAHQLQTPMAGIRLLVGDMIRTNKANPSQPMDAEVLGQLDEVAVRGARMVKQLLAYARVKDAQDMEEERFDAISVVLQTVARWQKTATAAHKQIRLDNAFADDQFVELSGSPTLLAEAISNLIDNALRYGGFQLLVRLQQTAKHPLRITVTDDGPELDETTRSHMLLPFWRGNHGLPDGSGLGLSIVNSIIARLGGSLQLLRKGPLTGACFEISFEQTAISDSINADEA